MADPNNLCKICYDGLVYQSPIIDTTQFKNLTPV